MDWQLRDYQEAAVQSIVDWGVSAACGDKHGWTAPTGTGKSLMELEAKKRLGDGWWLITPRLEIARGFLQKLGYTGTIPLIELVDRCFQHQICTPIRFRNKLFRGEIQRVDGILFDEGHHATASSWQDVWVAAGMPPTALLTATWFRGTSKQTAKFIETWGEPDVIITLEEAANRGDISIPQCEVLPLVDDDIIELNSTGEFDVHALESETMNRVEDMARIAVSRWYNTDQSGCWDRVTVFCLPGLTSAREMMHAIAAKGGTAGVIDAKTTDAERQFLFTALLARKLALVQISVVGEGVDLPIRRLVDLAPCMSPTKWMQQLGRSTRPIHPGEALPEYICTNRNLQRHAYLLEGLIPPAKVAEAAEAFGDIGKRAGVRALGLESLGRFKAVNVRLVDGNVAQFFFLVDSKNGRLTEYACCAHPTVAEPIWAIREHSGEGTARIWGHWRPIKQPSEIRGFVSQTPRPPSPKQAQWWNKQASWYGLDPDVKLTQKNFAALPFCVDLGLKLARTPR